MQELASDFDELKLLYPNMAQLSAIALTIPVSSVNCERDFSGMNRTDLRNRLQGKSLTACLRIKINGPPVADLDYSKALEEFFQKQSDPTCTLCKK